jgi:hypothetical protein
VLGTGCASAGQYLAGDVCAYCGTIDGQNFYVDEWGCAPVTPKCDGIASYLKGAATTTSDRCQPITTCNESSYTSTVATSNSDGVCTTCDPGTYQGNGVNVEGLASCKLCDGITTDDDNEAATPCKECIDGAVPPLTRFGNCIPPTACPKGRYFVAASGETPASCLACAVGTYQGNGVNIEGPGSCEPCAEGTEDHDNKPATVCEPIEPPGCPAGQYLVPATEAGDVVTALLRFQHQLAAADVLCEPCPTGSVAAEGSATKCEMCQNGQVPNAFKSECVAGQAPSTSAAAVQGCGALWLLGLSGVLVLV